MMEQKDISAFRGIQIGIAGPSCSGKSTVAELLAQHVELPLFHLDGRWVKGSPKAIVNGHKSFERPTHYNGDGLAEDLKSHPHFIAEGFLLFLYKDLLNIPFKFFIDLPYEEQLARRLARASSRKDDRLGGVNDVAEIAWRHNGKEEWEAFGAKQKHIEDMVCLSGLEKPEVLVGQILKRLDSKIMRTIIEKQTFLTRS